MKQLIRALTISLTFSACTIFTLFAQTTLNVSETPVAKTQSV